MPGMVVKRRRTYGRGYQKKPKIDKELVSQQLTTAQLAQSASTLYTTTYPFTLAGLRWSIVMRNTNAAPGEDAIGVWAIVRVPAGSTAQNIAQGAGVQTLYGDVKNVLAWGQGNATSGFFFEKEEGSTKTKRKMENGDKLQLLIFNASPVAGDIIATYFVIQFFNIV